MAAQRSRSQPTPQPPNPSRGCPLLHRTHPPPPPPPPPPEVLVVIFYFTVLYLLGWQGTIPVASLLLLPSTLHCILATTTTTTTTSSWSLSPCYSSHPGINTGWSWWRSRSQKIPPLPPLPFSTGSFPGRSQGGAGARRLTTPSTPQQDPSPIIIITTTTNTITISSCSVILLYCTLLTHAIPGRTGVHYPWYYPTPCNASLLLTIHHHHPLTPHPHPSSMILLQPRQ